MSKLSEKIAKDRAKKGETLDIYSKKLDISIAQMFRLEHGATPRYKTIVKLANYFGVKNETIVKLMNEK